MTEVVTDDPHSSVSGRVCHDLGAGTSKNKFFFCFFFHASPTDGTGSPHLDIIEFPSTRYPRSIVVEDKRALVFISK